MVTACRISEHLFVHVLFVIYYCMRDSRLISHATLIHSAFHLSYNMLLNQMRCEDGDPEKLLRNSFYQFQSDRALPDLEVS